MSTSAVLWPCGTKLFSVRPSGNLVPAGRPKSLTTIATLSRALSLMMRGSWFATTCWFMLALFRCRRVGKAKRAHRLSFFSPNRRWARRFRAFAHPTDLTLRHCEEPPGLASGEPEGRLRDEAIQSLSLALDCFASVAMTPAHTG